MDVRKLYQSIGQSIVDSISDNWVEAKLNIEYIGSIGFNLNYSTDKNETKSEWIENEEVLSDKIVSLHEITTENEKNKWNKAVFSIKRDGDFDMEFIWDQEAQDEVESFSEN